MAKTKPRGLDEYPNVYPDAGKSCFDCLNLKVKLAVGKDGHIKFSKTHYAVCKKGFILRTDKTRKPDAVTGDLLEPKFLVDSVVWTKLERGWRHGEWTIAGVCPHFDDMREDPMMEKIIRAGKILDAEPCLSTMAMNPQTGEVVEFDEQTTKVEKVA